MPATDQYAVTPENATPERCLEVFTAYKTRLEERANVTVADDPERARKVEHSLRYLETTLAYWIGCLLEADGSTDPVTDEIRWQIRQLREEHAGHYDVPEIEAEALKVARNMHKLSRESARASVARRQSAPPASQAPAAPAPSSDPIDALESAMASMYGLTVAEYRAQQQE